MRIKRLYIGDFGILRNQTLDNLHSGMVVVGGLNRAGKSTFMNVLKHLGYGFSKTGQIPPANIKYQVEGDILMDDDMYQIRLEGLSDPILSSANSDSNNISIKDIYSVDAFTYKHLFAISLDQLTKVPEDINNRELLQLQSILLGAGLSDIAEIPQLERKFSKEAKDIGGTRGNLDNKGFKTYASQIKGGMEKKKAALAQVDEYRNQQLKLSAMEQEKNDLQESMKYLQSKADILELLKGSYDIFEDVQQTGVLLDEHNGRDIASDFPIENIDVIQNCYQQYIEYKDKWDKLYDNIESSLDHNLDSRDTTGKVISLLLTSKDAIEGFYNKTAGIRERWNGLARLEKQANEDKSNIIIRLKRLNGGWLESDLNRIENLSLGLLEEDKLIDAVSKSKSIRSQIEQLEYRQEEILVEIERLSKQKAEWKTPSIANHLKFYSITFVISALLGIGLYSLHPVAGLLIGLFGIIGSALFILLRSIGEKEARSKQQEIANTLKGNEDKSSALMAKIAQYKEQEVETEAYLMSVKGQLGMDSSITPDGVLEYYKAMVDLQERIYKYNFQLDDMKTLSQNITTELSEIKDVLDTLESRTGSIVPKDQTYFTLNDWEDMQFDLDKWYKVLRLAIQLDAICSVKVSVETKLRQLMGDIGKGDSLDSAVESFTTLGKNKQDFLQLEQKKETLIQSLNRAINTDRLQRAVALLKPESLDGTHYLYYFFDQHGQYSSQEELVKYYYAIQAEAQEIEQKIEGLKKDSQTIMDDLKRLALTTELEQAHLMINRGRSELYPVAYHYAVLKAASYLCEDISDSFMDKMRDELLNSADTVLNELTTAAYNKITPSDDLLKPDFSFSLADGMKQKSVDVLSRGTQEQVFLAIRLGRIMDMKPALPIIIDDSFVNFDPLHLKKAIQILHRLSWTHQIFIMTCHPHLISLIEETGAECQYWQLENGQFSGTDSDTLIKHLS